MDQAPAKEIVVDKKRKCEGGDCENDAGSLQCPNCQKLGKESYFCSQDCFKRNWVGRFSDSAGTLPDPVLTGDVHRVRTSKPIKQPTVCSPPSFRRKSSLNPMQMDTSIPSPPFPSPDLCAQYTL